MTSVFIVKANPLSYYGYHILCYKKKLKIKKKKKEPCLSQNEITLNLKGQKCTLGKNLKDQFWELLVVNW